MLAAADENLVNDEGLLTVIQVTRPEPTDTNPRTAEIAQWTEKDQISRGATLSALSDTLFDVYYFNSYTAKSLWNELDRKYNTEEKRLEKYYVSKFMRYQMIEDRSIVEQTHEIINLEHSLADVEMKLPEKFLVIIKEEHRNQTNKMSVEHQPRANLIVGKQKMNKVGHWAKLCPNKKVKTGQATVNMVVGGSSGASTSGATEGYVSAITGRTVSMGNSSTAEVLGIGSVDLKFPSECILSLKRIHHVPTVRRNIS
ncbi:UNVERIFIED_CONTAM: hypothetical protein Slati_2716000 [Sesamum latifolium]|uniref:Retrovirus-related Pol polyprotein from transposon TNT 1-94-like beta-barrel domain-containing protein n=1 Tax=Sesamum latifolium TaxID=2727402 RepID=A0AAW2W0I5_9LAMI